MRLPPTGANGLEPRDWEGFKQDVNDFFTDLFSPVCKKFPKTLGCPKPQPEPEPTPPVVVPNPNPPNTPNPPNPNPPGNPGHTPPGQVPPTTTPVANPAPTTPAANPPPAATTAPAPVAPAPVVPAPQPTPAPGNGNDGNGNGGDGNGNNDGNGNGGGGGNGGGNTDPPSGGSNPSPTQGGGGGGSEPQPTTTRAGQGNGRPQNLGGNVLLVASNTASGPRPTSFADSQSGVTDELGLDDHDDPAPGPIFNNDADGPGPGRLLIDNHSGSQSPTPKPTGGYNGGAGYGDESGSGSSGDNGGGLNGGGISGGDGGPSSTNPENSHTAASPLPGIIGAVVSLVVLFLILFGLLYKYRRTRRVQSFLIRFTPLRIAPYSKLERKRSSMGSDLMFGCRGEQEPYTDEKRPWSMNYGSMDNAPAVTHPNPVAARRSRTDVPPLLELDISLANSVRSASPTSQFEPSPLSPSYPNMRTPPPARHSPRTSQDSTGGISIASSGVFNPSMITWPMPPSTTNSAIGSPPGTSHTANTVETYDTGPIIIGRSTPTRYKPIQPAQPSNWKQPQDWDV